jgi:hypothetical protein
MSSFHVEWSMTALDMLADIWTQASNRRAVNISQSQIDAQLAGDPIGRGTHLGEGLYKMVVEPLIVFYSVNETTKQVEVSVVWRTP